MTNEHPTAHPTDTPPTSAGRISVFLEKEPLLKSDQEVRAHRWTGYRWRDLLLLVAALALIALGLLAGLSGHS